jgi:predicted lipoprotein with Yx(FWY)xxD motif
MRWRVKVILGAAVAAILFGSYQKVAAARSRPVMVKIAPVELPPEVRVGRSDEGPVLTDSNGKTLYTWEFDNKPGQSVCQAAAVAPPDNIHPLLRVYANYPAPLCVQQWPPFLASVDARPIGDWSIFDRPEGTKQWAYKGRPLYRFYRDQLPGDVNGDAYGDDTVFLSARHRVEPPLVLPPGVVSFHSYHGLLTTFQGTVLYVFDHGVRASVTGLQKRALLSCKDGRCPGKWLPFSASAESAGAGKWTVLTYSDGAKQWAYDGRPVFRFESDHVPEDANGTGVDGAQLITLQEPPKPPRQVFVYMALFGPVYTNPQGLTLYYFQCAPYKPPGRGVPGETLACDGPTDDVTYREVYCPAPDRCAQMWRPFRAPEDAQPRGGTWSIAAIPDPVHYPLRYVNLGAQSALRAGAIKVWTYKGRPLYTFAGDHVAGDVKGHKIRQLAVSDWSAVLAGRLEQ